ncbi:hypothetical protein LTR66_005218 [Elasticomyces elasticus]|nr:hypothetical protein LTR66_005218 [Elasticomyces elasticus]
MARSGGNLLPDKPKAKKKKPAAKKPTNQAPAAQAPRVKEEAVSAPAQTTSLPLELQQLVLDVFNDALLSSSAFDVTASLQEVKKHLYNRDFVQAFGKDEYLVAYAARWSPTRALGESRSRSKSSSGRNVTGADNTPEDARDTGNGGGWRAPDVLANELAGRKEACSEDVPSAAVETDAESAKSRCEDESSPPQYDAPPPYQNIATHLEELHLKPQISTVEAEKESPPQLNHVVSSEDLDLHPLNDSFRITCLGGGSGAEVVALAVWLRSQMNESWVIVDDEDAPETELGLDIRCIDIARWHPVIRDLHASITKSIPPPSARQEPLLSPANAFDVKVLQKDLLDLSANEVHSLLDSTDVVTLTFTLNELYTTSVTKTQRFLFHLTACLRPGALLLVVDSPGSYSTVTINGSERQYPMQWLLDHTLLERSGKTGVLGCGVQWRKIESDESRWFRLPKGLKYPIELENMRMQMHLYRRCG